MIDKIEKLDIEKRASIYVKCNYIAVNSRYKKDKIYTLEGVRLSYYDIVEICHYAINSYGTDEDKRKYERIYDNNIKLDENIVKKIYYDRLKLIYNIKKTYSGNHKMMMYYRDLLRFNLKDINKLCHEYIVDYLKYDELEYRWFMTLCDKKNHYTNMSFSMLMQLLLKFNDTDDIIYIIEYSGIKFFKSSFSRIETFVKNNFVDNQESVLEELKYKVGLYLSYKEMLIEKKNKKDVEKVQEIDKEKIINEYIDSNCNSLYEFCKSANYDQRAINKYLSFIKGSNRKLYDRYLIKFYKNNDKNGRYVYNILCHWIINGYNGRSIDLLDMFSIPGFSFNKLDSIAIYSLDRNDYSLVRDFINNSKFKLNSLLLKNNNKISKENIDYIQRYLDLYNIDNGMFGAVVERIKSGVELDDLVINTINSVDNKNKERVR